MWSARRGRSGSRRVKDEIIAYAIAEAAKTFHIPATTIKEGNIRGLLKSGRIVVPSRLQTLGNDWSNSLASGAPLVCLRQNLHHPLGD